MLFVSCFVNGDIQIQLSRLGPRTINFSIVSFFSLSFLRFPSSLFSSPSFTFYLLRLDGKTKIVPLLGGSQQSFFLRTYRSKLRSRLVDSLSDGAPPPPPVKINFFGTPWWTFSRVSSYVASFSENYSFFRDEGI